MQGIRSRLAWVISCRGDTFWIRSLRNHDPPGSDDGSLTARHHLRRSAPIHVGLIENDVCTHMRWSRGEHLLLAHDQIGRVEARQFESVAMRDGVRRAGLDTISAENASVVIDVVNPGIALRPADTVFGSILRCFNVNAIRRTRRRAEKTSHAFFQTVLIALQHMSAAEPRFQPRATQWPLTVRVVFHDRGIKHLPERDAHSFGNGRDVFQDGHMNF